MKDSRLKSCIQRFLLRTQFPPLVWLYRLIYALALRRAVHGLGKVPGVRSIYLWRGLTAEPPLYGLSDIDLIIIVTQANDTRAAEARYDRLARSLPMLAKEQCNAAPVEQIRLEYKYDPITRFRLESLRPRRRLLFGEDLAAEFPPITTAELRTCVVEELRSVWIVLCGEVIGGSTLPLFARKFVLYKMVAEFARLTRLAEGADRPPSRAEAYRRAPQAFPQVAPMLAEIGSWRRKLLSPTPIPTEDVLDCVLHLARRVLAAPLVRPAFRRKVRLPASNPATVRMLLGEQALDAIRRARGMLPQVRRAVLVPRLPLWTWRALRFRVGRIRGGWIDEFIVVFIGGPRPSSERLRDVGSVLAGLPREIGITFQDQDLAIGWTQQPEIDFGSRLDRPDLFPDLSKTTPLADGLELVGSEEWELALHSADHFEVRAAVMLGRVDSERANVLAPRDYLGLFWEAGRAALTVAQGSKPVAEIPALSDQVADALAAWTPDEAPAIRRLYEEYALIVQGRPGRAEIPKDWTRQYARRLLTMIPRGPLSR